MTICHIPQSNPDAAHTIQVDQNAVDTHLEHGDYLGECKENDDSEKDKQICKKNIISNGNFETNNFGKINKWANIHNTQLNKWYLVQTDEQTRWSKPIDLNKYGENRNGTGILTRDYQKCSYFCSVSVIQIVEAKEGVEYTLSAYAKKLKDATGGSLYLDFLNENKYRISGKSKISKGGFNNEDFTKVTNTRIAPKGTKYIRVILYSSNKAQGEILWDDVNLYTNQTECN